MIETLLTVALWVYVIIGVFILGVIIACIFSDRL